MNKLLQPLAFALLMSNSALFAQCPDGTTAVEQNLVRNGDFEEPVFGFSSDYIRSRGAGAGRFNVVDDANNFSNKWFVGTGNGYFMAVDGAQGRNMTVWQQTIDVKPNTVYFFSAWLSTLMPVKYGPPAVLQFSVNNRLLDNPFICPNETRQWQQFFANWNSGNNQTATIRVVSQNSGYNGNDFGLDRIRFYECRANNVEQQLNDVKIGEEIELRDIFFESGKSLLMPNSYDQLNRVASFLSQIPSANIQISGHTDNVGDSITNQRLSESRAQAVADYLCTKGIDAKCITATGYGESQPVSSNETMEGRQINRRVTLKVLSK